MVDGILLWKNYDGVLLRCLEEDDANKVFKDLHDGLTGGHFSEETTTHKILRANFDWPTLFRDAHSYVRKCKDCQLCDGKENKCNTPVWPLV